VLFVVALGLLAFYRVSSASHTESIPYPRDYRKWIYVKTQLVGPQSPFFETAGGIHHIYANATAMEGCRTVVP
jgi:hypothetical protein